MNLTHGLCASLGRNKFNRISREKERRKAGIKPRKFTGLSLKTMSRLEYDRALRKLKNRK